MWVVRRPAGGFGKRAEKIGKIHCLCTEQTEGGEGRHSHGPSPFEVGSESFEGLVLMLLLVFAVTLAFVCVCAHL